MKFARVAHILFLTCFTLQTAFAQKAELKEGDRLFERLAYKPAIEQYKQALNKDKNNIHAIWRLAHSYRMTNDMDSAEFFFSKLVDKDADYDSMAYFYYGRALHANAKYDQAKDAYQKYLIKKPGDPRAILGIEATEMAEELKSAAPKYYVKTSPFNSAASDMAPTYFKDESLVFVSDRRADDHSGKTFKWTGRPFYNVYVAEKKDSLSFSKPTQLTGSVNTKYHDGPVTFSPDYNTMYFTRTYYDEGFFGGSVKTDENDVVLLKIMSATFDSAKNKWSEPKDLPFVFKDYSVAHPTLSADGNTMYFSSNMPGGYGGLDLYKVTKNGNSWSEPQNLGTTVNTLGDELFPFIAVDSTLYFSSNTHPGLGGLDVFAAKMNTSGNFDNVRNVGIPINSAKDDFGYIVAKNNLTGYFSSNREAGTGSDDIYMYNFLKITLKGTVVEKDSEDTLQDAQVILINKRTNATDTIRTGADGSFTFDLDAETEYVIKGDKERYAQEEKTFNTYGTTESRVIREVLALKKLGLDVTVDLYNIYFDFDRSFIRRDASTDLDTLYKILNENPNISVEIGAHTDSRGSDIYNEKLSQRRAQAVVDYLIEKGIDRNRLEPKGYGEYKLTNECSNGVNCTPIQHQRNRRAHFKVIGTGDTLESKERYTSSTDVPPGQYPGTGVDRNRSRERDTKESRQIPIVKPQDLKNRPTSSINATYLIEFATIKKDNRSFVDVEQYGTIIVEQDGKYYHYLVGVFETAEAAQQVLSELQVKGFSGAQIVKFVDGKRNS